MLTYEKDSTMRAMAKAAVAVELSTGFPAIVTLSMSANESAWWTKQTGKYNYWGITRDPNDGPAKMCFTHENLTLPQLVHFRGDEKATAVKIADLGGGVTRYSMMRWFASYSSLQESLTAYAEFFTKSPKRYAAAWQQYQQDHDADALLKNICKAGYATGPAEQVEIAIEHQSNIIHAIEQARADMAVS